MEMCYDGALVMPSNYAVMDEDDMMYVEGGFSISKNVFKYSVTAIIVAVCIALGGALSVAGLKTVLASYTLKTQLISTLVGAIGKLGICAGNTLASKFVSGLAGCVAGDFVENIFTKYIDGLDGKNNGKIKIW